MSTGTLAATISIHSEGRTRPLADFGPPSEVRDSRRAPLRPVSRAALAHSRLPQARDALTRCRLCAHDCGVNRVTGQRGDCRAGRVARLFCQQVEVGDELELIPTFAIALSGCDLRCDFCITGAQSWNPEAGEMVTPSAIAAQAQAALGHGARTVMFLGGEPTIHLPTVLEMVTELPDSAPLVWKTNAHATGQARALLEGLFDVWLADYKFGNDRCAARLARVPDYTRVVQENLLWMWQQAGDRSRWPCELMVRHLLLPGHTDCCWRAIAEWLAATLPQVKVSLRDSYWPAWRSARHRELAGTVSANELARARALAHSLQLNLIP